MEEEKKQKPPKIMTTTEGTPDDDAVYSFRVIAPNDNDRVKSLHEECFPIRYSDRFFRDACLGIGFEGGNLFTSLAVLRTTGEVVGFIFAQIMPESECGDSGLLDRKTHHNGGNLTNNNNGGKNSSNKSNTEDMSFVCYILTLGLKREYRRGGLGSKLLAQCLAYAESNRYCGAVYLHVIHNNPSAIAFYRRHDFIHFRSLNSFYSIDGVNHTAYLYILYINDYQAPLLYRLLNKVQTGIGIVLTWFAQTLGMDKVGIEGPPAGTTTPSPSPSAATVASVTPAVEHV